MLIEQHPGLANGWIFRTQRGIIHTTNPLNIIIHCAVANAGITTHLTPITYAVPSMTWVVAWPQGQLVRVIVGHATESMTEHYSIVDVNEKHAVPAAVLRLVNSAHNVSTSRDGPRLSP